LGESILPRNATNQFRGDEWGNGLEGLGEMVQSEQRWGWHILMDLKANDMGREKRTLGVGARWVRYWRQGVRRVKIIVSQNLH